MFKSLRLLLNEKGFAIPQRETTPSPSKEKELKPTFTNLFSLWCKRVEQYSELKTSCFFVFINLLKLFFKRDKFRELVRLVFVKTTTSALFISFKGSLNKPKGKSL